VTLPGDLTTTTLTGTFLDCAGSPLNGSLTITPSTDVSDATGEVVIAMTERVYQISAQGTITTDGLVATDNANLSPQGWVYQVTLQIAGLAPKAWSILLPYSSSPVDISGITPVVAQPDVTSYVALTGGDMTGLLTLSGGLQIPEGAEDDYVLTSDAEGNATWQEATGGGGSGSVTTISVASANGFAGTVANATTTPALTLETTVTGLLKGNGTGVSAAVSGTDYDAAGAAATAQSNAESFATSAVATETSRAETAEGLALAKASNLSDVTTRQTALNNLAGGVTSGDYLRGNGTNVTLSAIQAGDVPTLNQSTTGSAASFTGSLAGDVTGTQGATSVAKIQGTTISSPSGGAARFLSASGTWISPALTPLSSPVTASTVTAAVGQFVQCDTTSNAITVTLPASGAADQSQAGVKMITQGSSSGVPYAVTVNCASGDHFNVASTGSTSLTLSVAGQGVLLQYDHALSVWYVLADDIPLGQADIRYGATIGTIGSATGTENLTLGTAAVWNVTLAGNTTFAFEGPSSPSVQSLTVYVTQAASGGPYSVTWPGSVTWFGGTAPAIATSAASALTVVTLQTINGGTAWYGGIVSNAALPLTVGDGGTGLNALATYELLAGGTGTTSPVGQIGTGTDGQVLTSNGAGAYPSFQAPGTPPIWEPADSGLVAWNYDPCITNGGSQALATAGTLYVMAMKVNTTTSVTNIFLDLTVNGSGLTHGFAGLWQGVGGALLGVTSDQATSWGSGSVNSAAAMAIYGGPVTVTAGVVYVGVWFTGTTGPTFYKAAAQNFVNVGLVATSARWGTANTGLTTTAPSTLGTISLSEYAYWAALGP
jgi:hypothetical protein